MSLSLDPEASQKRPTSFNYGLKARQITSLSCASSNFTNSTSFCLLRSYILMLPIQSPQARFLLSGEIFTQRIASVKSLNREGSLVKINDPSSFLSN